uniref:F-box/LRR-repeat protein n=1 Tax=Ascaris lumbricoides TaxID=6252 RepID=A0A0M3IDR0_ASCLU
MNFNWLLESFRSLNVSLMVQMCEHVNEVLNDPWAVFAEPLERNPSDSSLTDNNVAPTLEQLWSSRRRISDGKWRWLCDVCDVLDAGYDCELGESLDSFVVKFKFVASEYSICLRRSSDFPESAPEVNSSLGAAFELNWNEDSTLLSTCSEYGELCSLYKWITHLNLLPGGCILMKPIVL